MNRYIWIIINILINNLRKDLHNLQNCFKNVYNMLRVCQKKHNKQSNIFKNICKHTMIYLVNMIRYNYFVPILEDFYKINIIKLKINKI